MAGKVYICGVDTSKLPTLKSEEAYEMMLKIKNGNNAAREEFINANFRLVLSICQRFGDKKQPMDDIFQVGCIGLIKAIDNFDLSQNVRFSTYAVPMIMGEIRRFIRDNSSMRVTRSMRDIAYRALKSRELFSSKFDRLPTMEEIAEDIQVESRDVVCALDAISESISLEETVYSDGQDSILVMDQVSEKKDIDELEKLALRQALHKLSKKEKQILLMRYYIGKTQVEISEEIGISQAQVSRLEKTALKSIKKGISN